MTVTYALDWDNSLPHFEEEILGESCFILNWDHSLPNFEEAILGESCIMLDWDHSLPHFEEATFGLTSLWANRSFLQFLKFWLQKALERLPLEAMFIAKHRLNQNLRKCIHSIP